MSDHGNSLIKTPRQLLTVVVLSFVVPVIVIILLAIFVVRSTSSGVSGSDAFSEKAVEERMRPVGAVVFAEAGAAKTLQSGDAVYTAACSACHAAGLAGAPRTGDVAAWAPRIRSGFDLLVKHAVEGFKAMPPKGGNSNLDPVEVARAVVFMANQSGGKFKEPAAPVTSMSAASATATSTAIVPANATPTGGSAPIAAPADAKTSVAIAPDGAKIYASGCNACHAAGVANAPKLGDKAAWAPRIAQGMDALTASVIKGKGVMPPRGAVPSATDADLRAAVAYMVASVK